MDSLQGEAKVERLVSQRSRVTISKIGHIVSGYLFIVGIDSVVFSKFLEPEISGLCIGNYDAIGYVCFDLGLILIYTVGDIGIIIADRLSHFSDEINHAIRLRHHFCGTSQRFHLITVHGIIKAIGPAHFTQFEIGA